MHRCTAHSIISCYAATTPPTQLYQQTSNKKYSCTSDHILEKTQNIFHTHVKMRDVLMEYTT
jgi:hypothetical protein